MQWLTLFISLIGASAWAAPYVYEKFFSNPTLHGKLVSFYSNSGTSLGNNCQIYFLALNVTSLHNDFNVKDTNIKVSYKNGSTEYEGNITWYRRNSWIGPDAEDGNITLDIEPEDFLLYIGTIPQNITKKIYVTFSIDKAEPSVIDKIKIDIKAHDGNTAHLVFSGDSLKEEEMLFDDRIWRKLSSLESNGTANPLKEL
jgi:hypothetical protein